MSLASSSTSEEGNYYGAIDGPLCTDEDDANDSGEIPVLRYEELVDIIMTLTHQVNSLNDHMKYLDYHVKYLDDHVTHLRDDLKTFYVKSMREEVKTTKRRSICSRFLNRREKADQTEKKTPDDDATPEVCLCTCCWPFLRLVSLLYKRLLRTTLAAIFTSGKSSV
jgi:hypothetical protein